MVDPFEGIVGNDQIKNYLTRMVEKGTLAQSLLFTGPDGIGQSLFAQRFANLIVGTDKSHHPDIYHYHTEGKIGMHSIQSMRQFSEEVYLAPFEAKKKALVIHDAHRMLTYSANALLKTFEEPAPDSIIILLSSCSERILPTILSRCQTVRFLPIPPEDLTQLLQKKHTLPQDKATQIALRAQGSLGQAERLLEEDDNPIRDALLNALAEGSLSNYSKILQMVKETNQHIQLKLKEEEEQVRSQLLKDFSDDLTAAQKQSLEKEVEGYVALQRVTEAGTLFETILSWYRDLHLLYTNADPQHLINGDYQTQLTQALQKGGIFSLEKVQQAISKAKLALERSTPLEYCLENLFLSLGPFHSSVRIVG